jgi:hypothetical protein
MARRELGLEALPCFRTKNRTEGDKVHLSWLRQ